MAENVAEPWDKIPARAARRERMSKEAVAILGGTGEQGLGLAYRFAIAGRPVRIGSRKEDRALEAMRDVAAKVPGADVSRSRERGGGARRRAAGS